MNKIENTLARLLGKNMNLKYKVIVVTKNDHTAEDLGIAQFKYLMGSILSAELTGHEIVKLAKNDELISIELDGTMRIL